MLDGHTRRVVKERPSRIGPPVDDVRPRVAGTQEVRVQGVRQPPLGNGTAGGDQRLGRGPGPRRPGDEGGPAAAAEDVLLDPLQVEQIEQGRQFVTHTGDSAEVVRGGVTSYVTGAVAGCRDPAACHVARHGRRAARGRAGGPVHRPIDFATMDRMTSLVPP
ncbi:hypothetical protein TPA0909_05010 [Streptomyces albus]|nr:hypothetical protein TPA0909_05010 [Streptomyces albus]